LFGKYASEETKKLMKKIPAKFFKDFSEKGGLYYILLTYFQLDSLNKMDFSNKENILEYFQTLQQNLKNSGLLTKRVFLISSKYNEENYQLLEKKILKLGGEITKDGKALYLLEPNPESILKKEYYYY
jgi:hypothetical protein